MTKYALQEKYKEEDKKQAEEDKNKVRAENISKELLEKLPTPSGWRILVLPFEPKDKTKGGIIIAQESLDKLRIATNCGYVIKVGPLAYKDENKFFNALNRNFVKWGPASGLYKTIGVDEMPLEIIDPDYYDAISFYGSSFWKQRAVDTPARKLIQSGHVDTYAYRFDWDELSTINDMDL